MNNYLIIHETAHEWWGNSVTAPDYAEVWLQEGFATYSEALYAERINGYNAYLSLLQLYSFFIKNKQPIVGPRDVNYWNYKDGDVYMKGALTLFSLRNAVNNDKLFFDIIRTFYQTHKYGTAHTSEFISLVNEKSGQDYSAFFQQYLYSRECPNLEYTSYKTGKNEYCFAYKLSNTIPGFKMPIQVSVDGETTKLTATDSQQYFYSPSDVSFDFQHQLYYCSGKKNGKLRNRD